MNLLLSNDDGVSSPGLIKLANTLKILGEVRVVAPDRDRSGASNSLTLDRPLRPTTLENGFIAVDGTPTDCVYLGMSGLLDITPDLVVAGINTGANLGDDVLYSGTVAAAMEGRFLGLPALAISLASNKQQHFDTAALIAKRFIESWSSLNLAPRTLLNVNVPDVPIDEIKGVRLTRLGHRGRANQLTKMKDPRGITRYWIAAVSEGEDADTGTDFHAIKEGYVAVTPLQVDMTRYDAFSNLENWLKVLL